MPRQNHYHSNRYFRIWNLLKERDIPDYINEWITFWIDELMDLFVDLRTEFERRGMPIMVQAKFVDFCVMIALMSDLEHPIDSDQRARIRPKFIAAPKPLNTLAAHSDADQRLKQRNQEWVDTRRRGRRA